MAHPQIAALLHELERHKDVPGREDRIAAIKAEIEALKDKVETAEAPRASRSRAKS